MILKSRNRCCSQKPAEVILIYLLLSPLPYLSFLYLRLNSALGRSVVKAVC